MINVAVIYGGKSKERDVSLKSGKAVAVALRAKGVRVKEIDYVSKDIIQELDGIDIAYLALHGKYGEDGRIQGLLDILEIPYVGSGVLASALAMNKAKAKRIFDYYGIRVAKDLLLKKKDNLVNSINEIQQEMDFPVVIKPNEEGSTIGLSIVPHQNDLQKAIEVAFSYDDEILVEEYIVGTEVTIAVLEINNTIQTLPIIEIVPNKNNYYDFESKYAPGGSDHIIPARISKENEELLKKWAIEAHTQLGCQMISRVDFIIPNDASLPVILEVNTLPGMTETSLYPDAAKAFGISYEDLVYLLVQTALNKNKK